MASRIKTARTSVHASWRSQACSGALSASRITIATAAATATSGSPSTA